MPGPAKEGLLDSLAAVPDPRRQCANLRHKLLDVLVIGFCGVISGCNNFTDMEVFGQERQDFFRQFLELPNGIPAHDTFRRVLRAVSPGALRECLTAWLLRHRAGGGGDAGPGPRLIAVDGKALRGTADRRRDLGALYVVSAWASEQGLTLGQVAVDGKSNEITAIPELLALLELNGAVVSIDAAGCQQDIAGQIVEQGGDYVLALKGNQPTLHEAVTGYFEGQLNQDRCDRQVRHRRSTERGHGRLEAREIYVAPVPPDLAGREGWEGLASMAMVVRESTDLVSGETTGEVRFYISSLQAKAMLLSKPIRCHWGIENGLHWVLDMAFAEDGNRTRDRVAAQNLALLNRLAVSLLRNDTSRRCSIRNKRNAAGWNPNYLRQLLGIGT
jgi:predicted transposase YbfD/YdcC